MTTQGAPTRGTGSDAGERVGCPSDDRRDVVGGSDRAPDAEDFPSSERPSAMLEHGAADEVADIWAEGRRAATIGMASTPEPAGAGRDPP